MIASIASRLTPVSCEHRQRGRLSKQPHDAKGHPVTHSSEKPEAKTLLTDIAFGESPRWRGDRFWFADWGAKEIVAVDANGSREVMVRVSFPSFPMSFDWLLDGRLLVVSARDGLLLRQEPDGSLATHADLNGLAPKGLPWNELVVDGRGNAYINNTGFEFPGGEFAPGSIALLTSDGSVRKVADGIAFPNGMVVTSDNATLIVAESYGQRLTAFDIAPDGGLSNRRIWAGTGQDHPDGICLDAQGAVWYADVASKRCVRVRKGGEVLQVIDLDRGCFACVLGGEDRKTLYMLATEWRGVDQSIAGGARTGQVLTIEAAAPGAGWP
ncbi:MAG: SMP-30/gluconolactonase/LRE family protein [Bradyrhizobium sp.]|nr:MAG: SMP-30/gluconolactonase/LRE family protein [Bradyrhizobium sp.]